MHTERRGTSTPRSSPRRTSEPSNNADLRHHPAVFVIDDVAVEEERPSNDGIAEIDQDFHGRRLSASAVAPLRREIDDVEPAAVPLRFPVDRLDDEVDLMDMEGVDLVGLVDERPFLDGSGTCGDQR